MPAIQLHCTKIVQHCLKSTIITLEIKRVEVVRVLFPLFQNSKNCKPPCVQSSRHDLFFIGSHYDFQHIVFFNAVAAFRFNEKRGFSDEPFQCSFIGGFSGPEGLICEQVSRSSQVSVEVPGQVGRRRNVKAVLPENRRQGAAEEALPRAFLALEDEHRFRWKFGVLNSKRRPFQNVISAPLVAVCENLPNVLCINDQSPGSGLTPKPRQRLSLFPTISPPFGSKVSSLY